MPNRDVPALLERAAQHFKGQAFMAERSELPEAAQSFSADAAALRAEGATG